MNKLNNDYFIKIMNKTPGETITYNNIMKSVDYNFAELHEVQKRKRARIHTEEEVKTIVNTLIKTILKKMDVNFTSACDYLPDNAFSSRSNCEGTHVMLAYENNNIKVRYIRKEVHCIGSYDRYLQCKNRYYYY